MPLRSLIHRRPSAATVIALLALFVSLSGVGYAAVFLPDGSVGSAQLRNEAVTFRKIAPGSVGVVRANLGQIQARVLGTCTVGTAIGSIGRTGQPNCTSALPAELSQTGTAAAVASSPTSVATLGLPAPSTYLVLANPTAEVKASSPEAVTVTCTLADGSASQTRSVTLQAPGGSAESAGSIPLMVPGSSGTTNVSCQTATSGSAHPTVSVSTSLNALETAHNG